jgi:hypothetical protein
MSYFCCCCASLDTEKRPLALDMKQTWQQLLLLGRMMCTLRRRLPAHLDTLQILQIGPCHAEVHLPHRPGGLLALQQLLSCPSDYCQPAHCKETSGTDHHFMTIAHKNLASRQKPFFSSSLIIQYLQHSYPSTLCLALSSQLISVKRSEGAFTKNVVKTAITWYVQAVNHGPEPARCPAKLSPLTALIIQAAMALMKISAQVLKQRSILPISEKHRQ